MREIVLDTETTGLDPAEHKLIEIGCVELHNMIPSGETYHVYINPEREVEAEAIAVHGLDNTFLKDKPIFAEIYTDFLDFIEGARLVIHNAPFDIGFLNAELKNVGAQPIQMTSVFDTLDMARKKYPGSPATLDALCARFSIDNSNRTLHGALLDSELLAEVYLEMSGGRQHGLGILPNKAAGEERKVKVKNVDRPFIAPRDFTPSPEQIAAHKNFIKAKIKDPIWANYIDLQSDKKTL